MNRTKSLLSILIILIISVGITFYIFSTEPIAQQEAATKKSAMLVETISGEQGDFRPTIKATGTIQPSKDISLSTRVAGEVIRMAQDFIPGATVKQGELLVQIDPADYKNTLELRESDLEVVQAQLQLEMGMQEAAKNDYKMANDQSLVKNKALLLREPQLATAKANVKAAQARVDQAKLDLQRTSIRAPFDAHIITRSINKGSQVNVGGVLGRLVGTDEYWVMLNVPISTINWLEFPENSEISNVQIRNSTWSKNQYRKGSLYQLVGSVTDQSRLAQVIVKIEDPMKNSSDQPKLVIGTFVEAKVPARELKNVVRLSRGYLRKGNTVWIMKDGALNVREVNVAFEDENYVYISEGLSKDDQVIITNLSTVVEGSALRTEADIKQSNAQ